MVIFSTIFQKNILFSKVVLELRRKQIIDYSALKNNYNDNEDHIE